MSTAFKRAVQRLGKRRLHPVMQQHARLLKTRLNIGRMLQHILADRLRCPPLATVCMRPQKRTSGADLVHSTGAAELHEFS